MNLAQHACNYAVLRFLPYPETGEFVNVGVVAYCPEMRWAGHAGDEADAERVTRFFHGMGASAYLRQKQIMRAELDRVCALLRDTTDRKLGNNIFLELVRQRDSVFRFGDVRTVLAHDPQKLIENLCDQYVRQRRHDVDLAV